jgi:hypothetical protein
MTKSLSRLFRREQMAFLGRDRSAWGPHLDRVRAFLGEGLQEADPVRPVLVLGAGSGLEVPWDLAPATTTGWDADPWSRIRTLARHRRWPPWVFEDMTGGLGELEQVARRCAAEPWSRRWRNQEEAARRLTGLLPSLTPVPRALRAWIQDHQPGSVLVANVMGQFGVVAQRLAEAILGPGAFEADPERADPLADALEAWTHRALRVFLTELRISGARLWLVHDCAVIFSEGGLDLGPWAEDWRGQLRAGGPSLEVHDPLAGLRVGEQLEACGTFQHRERWLWDLAPGQRHVVEALAWQPGPP